MSAYKTSEAFLARLPRGEGSYPHCKVKVALLRDMLRSRAIHPPEGSLPAEILDTINNPPPVSSWTPTVFFNAISLAIYDEHFKGSDLEGFRRWVFDFNGDVFKARLYRVLFSVLSTTQVMNGYERRWSAFHAGTQIRVLVNEPGRVKILHKFPPHLYCVVMQNAMLGGLQAALTASGAKGVNGRIEMSTISSAQYLLQWNS